MSTVYSPPDLVWDIHNVPRFGWNISDSSAKGFMSTLFLSAPIRSPALLVPAINGGGQAMAFYLSGIAFYGLIAMLLSFVLAIAVITTLCCSFCRRNVKKRSDSAKKTRASTARAGGRVQVQLQHQSAQSAYVPPTQLGTSARLGGIRIPAASSSSRPAAIPVGRQRGRGATRQHQRGGGGFDHLDDEEEGISVPIGSIPHPNTLLSMFASPPSQAGGIDSINNANGAVVYSAGARGGHVGAVANSPDGSDSEDDDDADDAEMENELEEDNQSETRSQDAAIDPLFADLSSPLLISPLPSPPPSIHAPLPVRKPTPITLKSICFSCGSGGVCMRPNSCCCSQSRVRVLSALLLTSAAAIVAIIAFLRLRAILTGEAGMSGSASSLRTAFVQQVPAFQNGMFSYTQTAQQAITTLQVQLAGYNSPQGIQDEALQLASLLGQQDPLLQASFLHVQLMSEKFNTYSNTLLSALNAAYGVVTVLLCSLVLISFPLCLTSRSWWRRKCARGCVCCVSVLSPLLTLTCGIGLAALVVLLLGVSDTCVNANDVVLAAAQNSTSIWEMWSGGEVWRGEERGGERSGQVESSPDDTFLYNTLAQFILPDNAGPNPAGLINDFTQLHSNFNGALVSISSLTTAISLNFNASVASRLLFTLDGVQDSVIGVLGEANVAMETVSYAQLSVLWTTIVEKTCETAPLHFVEASIALLAIIITLSAYTFPLAYIVGHIPGKGACYKCCAPVGATTVSPDDFQKHDLLVHLCSARMLTCGGCGWKRKRGGTTDVSTRHMPILQDAYEEDDDDNLGTVIPSSTSRISPLRPRGGNLAGEHSRLLAPQGPSPTTARRAGGLVTRGQWQSVRPSDARASPPVAALPAPQRVTPTRINMTRPVATAPAPLQQQERVIAPLRPLLASPPLSLLPLPSSTASAPAITPAHRQPSPSLDYLMSASVEPSPSAGPGPVPQLAMTVFNDLDEEENPGVIKG
jgi:hypothetical protein